LNLKLIYSALVIGAFLVCQQTALSQFSFGLNTGLTYNGLTGDAPKDACYKRKIDFTAGIQFEYSVTRDISIGLGAGYYRTGTIVTYDIGEPDTKDSLDLSISYISIPLTFKVLTSARHTYFTSGLDFRQLLKAEMKYITASLPVKDMKANLQSFDASIFVGFGGIISLGRPSIGLELRYSHSLNNISKDNFSNSSGLPARFRFTGFQLLMFINYSSKPS
jgi:hypothetical protein